MTNHDWHREHLEDALKLFGFKSYKETITCVSSFFTNIKMDYPEIIVMHNKITLNPSHLIEFEEMLIANFLCNTFLTAPKPR